MTDRSEPLGPILAACVFGFGGIAAYLAGWVWLAWIGAGGFFLIGLWIILTQPAQKGTSRGDGGSMGLGDINSGGAGGDSGGAGGGGGDGGGGG